MNIQAALDSLARKRPIFHNEADLQHALAWELRGLYECKIRLERRMEIDLKRRTYLDMLIEIDGKRITIELKYKMRAVEHTFDEETFILLNQGAQDIGRYDVLKDLQRLEQMVKLNLVDEGYLIYLTNDPSYYLDPGVEKLTVDREFRIHEGRQISGILSWAENTGEGTMKMREEPLDIEGTYIMSWLPYSQLNSSVTGSIKSLIIPVNLEDRERNRRLYPEIKEPLEVHNPTTIIEEEKTECSMEINSIIKSLDVIPLSQFDLRDKLGASLKMAGYQVQINRDFGKAKIDIYAENKNDQLAIEVRYKTALLKTIFNGNHTELKNQAAQDISRYDFLKDLEKLETVIAQRPGTKGYAVLITNDRSYWEKTKRVTSVDEDFRIHQDRLIQGQLSWKNASGGTTHNRESMIVLKGQYHLDWQSFKILGTGKNEIFKMLVVEVISRGENIP
ncbi:hypothetical protein [Paenibacillus sp. LHD-38]|uniref:hypothetical protein n=1 Tax=Paenibacillus sp. LHD-38 TaxID=3072143 RepID=UPI00280DAF3F|nr:hypothetical protein [Paenibacillus sp. LHD-38]MDQ8733977.1 hypothetical protein [Paenibacillus sp. LHD-38]